MAHETDHAARMKQGYAGDLTEDERRVLFRIRDLFEAVAEKRAQLNPIAEAFDAKSRFLTRTSLDMNAMCQIEARLPQGTVGPSASTQPEKNVVVMVTENEAKFARDVIGVIDFIFRNGLRFDFLITTLFHDLALISDSEGLDRALERAATPRCDGYSEFTAEAVGDPEKEEK